MLLKDDLGPPPPRTQIMLTIGMIDFVLKTTIDNIFGHCNTCNYGNQNIIFQTKDSKLDSCHFKYHIVEELAIMNK